MKTLTTLLAAAAFAGLSSATLAQTGMTVDHVAAADTDADGAISQAEYIAFMEATFTTYDVNKDGNLEWSEVQEIIPVAVFKAADADSNNALSKAEFDAQVMKDFAAADKDADGRLN